MKLCAAAAHDDSDVAGSEQRERCGQLVAIGRLDCQRQALAVDLDRLASHRVGAQLGLEPLRQLTRLRGHSNSTRS